MTWLSILAAVLKGIAAIFEFARDNKLRNDDAAQSQLEAQNAEISRINKSADAASRLPIDAPDPNDLDK